MMRYLYGRPVLLSSISVILLSLIMMLANPYSGAQSGIQLMEEGYLPQYVLTVGFVLMAYGLIASLFDVVGRHS